MNLRLKTTAAVVAILFAGLLLPASAEAACQVINGTQDGRNKQRAVEKSRETLEEAIVATKRKNGWTNVNIMPVRVRATPLWKMVRTSVPKDAYLRPDVVSSRAYTVCWEGVYSPAVCSSGARICQR